jgi:hypothetical protein
VIRLTISRPARFVPVVTLIGLTATLALAGGNRIEGALSSTDSSVTTTRSTFTGTSVRSVLTKEDGAKTPIADALRGVDENVRIFDNHLSTLANPYMEGRVPGSEGMERAKDYIEYHLRQFGLEPAFPVEGSGVDGSGLSYRQPFALPGTNEVTKAEMAGLAGGRAFEFTAGEDFNVMGIGGSGDVTAGITFVGYGIDNGPDGWSSFAADTDLTGEIAVMLRFEPMDEDGNSQWADRGWSRRAGFGNKLRGVIDRGAAGVIIVSPPDANDPRAMELIEPGGGGRGNGSVPVVMMTAEAADAFLSRADAEGRSLSDMRRAADAGGAVVPLEGIVSISAMMERIPLMAENVGGLLRGKGDLADEYIVIGGHLDHLGMGYFGSRSGAGSLHPGADDNASGSAGILLMAQRMAEQWEALGDTPRRSILMVCFDGEESGLNGSRYYVDNPIAPIEKHPLMMNFDMIGRLQDGRVSVFGGNTADGFSEWLEPFYEETPLTVVVPERMSGASDHVPFYRRNIPVLFAICADFHDDYHTPDDVAWKINRIGGTYASLLFMDIAMSYAQRAETFPFAGSTPAGGQAGRAAAAAPTSDAPARAGIQVRFGIRPGSYIEGEEGIPIDDVTAGGSAAEAGVLAGDRLLRWDGRKLDSVQAWMTLLATHRPGDSVNIGVLRDGEEITLTVTLQGRDGDGG